MVKSDHRVFLTSGITDQISSDDIRSAFGTFGSVLDVYMPKDPNTGQLRGFAFVTLDSDIAVSNAVRIVGNVVSS